MKTALKFLTFLALALGASAQQGQMAANFTASSTAPFFTLNRAANTQESSIYFKTAGATTGGWRIYGSNTANQVLHFYSYQNAADVSALSSAGLSITGGITATSRFAATNSASGTAWAATGGELFANTTYGAVIEGYGTTNDVSIFNRSGSVALAVSANTINVTLSGTTTTSATGLTVTGTATSTLGMKSGSGGTVSSLIAFSGGFIGAGGIGLDITETDDFSGGAFAQFRNSTAGVIGSVTRVTTTNAVVYNTTSDARLKTNIRDFTESGPIIDGLRPRLFNWKSGGTDAIGFIAQEENAVDPALARIGAVTVGDDDPDCITKQWQRSDAALIPILVAELKSLRARVAALEALNTPASP